MANVSGLAPQPMSTTVASWPASAGNFDAISSRIAVLRALAVGIRKAAALMRAQRRIMRHRPKGLVRQAGEALVRGALWHGTRITVAPTMPFHAAHRLAHRRIPHGQP